MRRAQTNRAGARGYVLVAAAAIGIAALLLLSLSDFASDVAAEQADHDVSPLPRLPSRCRLSGAEALAHARALEQMATARWERVPFAIEEAPRALLQVAEAELCYGVLDRAGRLRTTAKRAEYEAEIGRRFARARLLLRVALRDQRLDRARKQIAVLRALLSRAVDEGLTYRAQLEQLDRAYAAQLVESAQENKQ
jgi:hypothetical protein